MLITKVPEDAAKEVREKALQRRFKGVTRDFFEKYSKDLRLKLLGPASSQESTPYRGMVYRYPEFGLVIKTTACPSGPPESPCSDLELSFIPAGPSR
jgi:hypothetical protein